ncbi:hypothetical protein [Melissospora conviva]|uniref:hypothetical protein n=1 Tax=Melissospora conviva TaxID=3388432 RepID=UPI003B80CB53
MRRSLATLTTTAVLIPLAVTAMPGAASAATNTLTVHVYDRAGTKVKTKVSLVNLGNRYTYKLSAHKAYKLPKGTYVAAAEINSPDGTTVLGGRTVKVSGASSTVIDARKGKRFRLALNPAVAEEAGTLITARVCGGPNKLVEASAWSGGLYVIPNGSDNLRLAYSAQWSDTRSTETSTTTVAKYATLDTLVGLPNNFNKTVQRSSLVPVTTTLRARSAVDQYQAVSLSSRAGGCARDLPVASHSQGGAFKIPIHVPAGKWRFEAATMSELLVRDRTFAKGARYSQTFPVAGRGPTYDLPYTFGRSLIYMPEHMFADPGFDSGFPDSNGFHFATGVKTSTTLTKGGKTLKKQTISETFPSASFRYTMKSAGWYGLTVHAKREKTDYLAVPAGTFSYRTTARFRFYANPNPTKYEVAPVYLTRFAPTGLNLYNEAKPGSTTNVNLTLQRKKPHQEEVKLGSAPKVKTMTAWASYDNGNTWKKVGVTKSGSKWIAKVKNPGSGYVTLRAKVVDAKGNSSDITIYRAYKIG